MKKVVTSQDPVPRVVLVLTELRLSLSAQEMVIMKYMLWIWTEEIKLD